ncbi:hypothetical protein AURDEDRAFT_113427, partial [Auricularia subglabra TFB-10046 SS5]
MSIPTALETLIIYCKCSSLRVSNDEHRSIWAGGLQVIEMEGSADLMRRLPCASIPEVSVGYPDEQSAEVLLGNL